MGVVDRNIANMEGGNHTANMDAVVRPIARRMGSELNTAKSAMDRRCAHTESKRDTVGLRWICLLQSAWCKAVSMQQMLISILQSNREFILN